MLAAVAPPDSPKLFVKVLQRFVHVHMDWNRGVQKNSKETNVAFTGVTSAGSLVKGLGVARVGLSSTT